MILSFCFVPTSFAKFWPIHSNVNYLI